MVFKTAYDIRAMGGVPLHSADQNGAFLFAFTVVSIFILLTSLPRKRRINLVLIPIAAAGIFGYLVLDGWDRRGSADALAQGKVSRVEGCIAHFVTNEGDFYSAKSSRQDEEWDVQGKHFGYKVTSYFPGYHKREVAGGVVHQGQYLRVTYLVSPIFRRTEIMEIEVGPQRCG